MLALTKRYKTILPAALLAVVAMGLPVSGAEAQNRELVLLLAPEPREPGNLQFALELADEARTRLQNRLRHRLTFVTSDDICKLLRDSGFECNHIIGTIDAARTAMAMGVDAYLTGEMWFANRAPVARFRIVDVGRSGLSGWMTVRGTPGDPPRAFAQTIVDSMLGQTRAAELARECNDLRDDGDFEEALEEAGKAFQMYPNHPSAAWCAAVVREAMGQPADSQIREYERAIRGDSLFDRAYQRVGQLYLSIGDSLGAIGAFRAQMYLTPDDRTRWGGVINQYITIGEYGEAETIVNQWLERNPNDMEFIQIKTRACFQGQSWDCAVEALEQQYSMNDDLKTDTLFYNDVLFASLSAGNEEAVLRWSEAAVENLPDNVDMWRARASTLSEAGMAAEAVAAFERVLMMDPEDLSAVMFLAQATLDGITIDTLVPLDTAALGLAVEYMDMATSIARDRADTAVLMNLAVMYYETGSALVQSRLDSALGVDWLQRALDNDVQQRLTQPANFFMGLGLVFMVFEFDPQIAAYVDRFADLTAADKRQACLLVAEEAGMVSRGKEAMTIGAGLSAPTAQQMLGQYATFEERIPQLREAFECN